MKLRAVTSFIFAARQISTGEVFDAPDGVARRFLQQKLVAVVDPESEGPGGHEGAGEATASVNRDPIATRRDPRPRRTRGASR